MAGIQELLCTETRALLGRLLDGELDAEESASVERHLDGCPLCAAELRSAERAFQALRGLPLEDRTRLRDQALRELGLDEPAPRTRRSRAARIVIFLVAFTLLVLWLRERRNVVPDVPRGVETR